MPDAKLESELDRLCPTGEVPRVRPPTMPSARLDNGRRPVVGHRGGGAVLIADIVPFPVFPLGVGPKARGSFAGEDIRIQKPPWKVQLQTSEDTCRTVHTYATCKSPETGLARGSEPAERQAFAA